MTYRVYFCVALVSWDSCGFVYQLDEGEHIFDEGRFRESVAALVVGGPLEVIVGGISILGNLVFCRH